MSESVEIENVKSSKTSKKFVTKFLPQETFDKVAIVLAEILGTATLVMFGCASLIHWDGPPSGITPPLTFGLTVAMVIQIFGHVSFAILNPAVTVCAVVNNLLSIKVKSLFYCRNFQ